MAQLSLYIDEDTLKKVKKAAKKQRVSVSEWVTDRIKVSFKNNWDANFFELFGSVNDPTFQRPLSQNLKADTIREDF